MHLCGTEAHLPGAFACRTACTACMAPPAAQRRGGWWGWERDGTTDLTAQLRGRRMGGDRRGRPHSPFFSLPLPRKLMESVSLPLLALSAHCAQVLGADDGDLVPEGGVRVRLWRFGRWETVVVDDRLPVPLCISSDAEQSEQWPALLEKAFAKIHGGYAGLSGGDVLWGVEDLTGGVCQRLLVGDLDVRPATLVAQGQGQGLGPLRVPRERDRDRDTLYGQLFRPIMQALRQGALVSCTPTPGHHQVLSKDILVSTVVDTKLTIRGPQLSVQDDIGSSPHWWDLEDFAKSYTNIIVTIFSTTTEELQVHELFGCWEPGISAGGSRNNLEKFAVNPQYILKVNHPDEHEEDKDFGRCSLLLALMQEHRRSTRGSRPPLLPIAYFIYKAELPGERLSAEYFLCVPEEVETGPFSNKREIAHRAELEPGNYVVIPATWSAGQQGGFLLRIFTVRKVTLEALPPYKPMCAMLPTWVPATEI